jgi:hypothetical protein
MIIWQKSLSMLQKESKANRISQKKDDNLKLKKETIPVQLKAADKDRAARSWIESITIDNVMKKK